MFVENLGGKKTLWTVGTGNRIGPGARNLRQEMFAEGWVGRESTICSCSHELIGCNSLVSHQPGLMRAASVLKCSADSCYRGILTHRVLIKFRGAATATGSQGARRLHTANLTKKLKLTIQEELTNPMTFYFQISKCGNFRSQTVKSGCVLSTSWRCEDWTRKLYS